MRMRKAKSPTREASATGQSSSFEVDALASLDSLYRTALRLTRVPADAEDLVQDTYLKAFRAADSFQPGTNLRAWLFTIMHNQNVNSVRSAMRESMTVEIEEQSSDLVATTDPTVTRQLHELDRALAQVPEEQRQVILLVGLEGMSYEDAAAILHVPVGTVRSRLSRGRDALRMLMGMGARTVKPGPWLKPKPPPDPSGRHQNSAIARSGLSYSSEKPPFMDAY